MQKILKPIWRPFSAAIDKLQSAFPPAKATVAAGIVLTPIVASVSGWAARWVPENLPGAPQFTSGQLTALMLTGIASGTAAVVTLIYKRVDGWQKHEDRVFYGKPAPGEDSDAVEIARIEAQTVEKKALIEAGHLPASSQALVEGEQLPMPADAAPVPLLETDDPIAAENERQVTHPRQGTVQPSQG